MADKNELKDTRQEPETDENSGTEAGRASHAGHEYGQGGFQALLKRSKERERLSRILEVGATLASGVLAAVSIAVYMNQPRLGTDVGTVPTVFTDKYFHDLQIAKKDIEALKATVTQLQSSTLPAKGSTLSKVSASVDAVAARVGKLEDALMTTPDRALAIPLIRKDIEANREQHLRDVQSMSADVARVYDMNKWVFGLIAAAVLGLVISNLFGRKSDVTPPSEKSA